MQCSKVTYPTEAKAEQVMRFLKHKGVRVRPYRCAQCNRWHLSSFD